MPPKKQTISSGKKGQKPVSFNKGGLHQSRTDHAHVVGRRDRQRTLKGFERILVAALGHLQRRLGGVELRARSALAARA